MATGIAARQLISLEKVRWRLALVWFPVCGLVFLLLIGQSIGGVYGDQLQRAWGWALPNFLPTLALMVSVFAADALRSNVDPTILVRRNFYLLSMALSAFYLLTLLVSILAQPALQWLSKTVDSGITVRMELLETSNIWLGPLQGLVIASIGVLFFLKEDPAATPQAPV